MRSRKYPLTLLLAAVLVACASRRTLSRADSTTAQPVDTTAKFPRTVAQAVDQALAKMTAGEKERIRIMRREDVPTLLHGFQMTARHEYGLSAGNPELLKSCGSETMVLEDCLLVILDAVWLALNK